MKLSNLKLKCVPTSSARAMVGSSVLRKENKTGINLTLTTGNLVRKPLRPLDLPERTCQLGSILGGTVELAVEG